MDERLGEAACDMLEYVVWFERNPDWNVDILPSGEPIIYI